MQPAPTLGHQPGLDGVRGIAVALVVVGHAWRHGVGAELGVQVFFVLSSFLITTLLLEEHAATGRLDLGNFYQRRALRLLPVLFAVLAIVTAVVLLRDADTEWYLTSVLAALAYVGNLYPFLSHHDDLAPAVSHLWSLAVEEQFYLVWPVVLWSACRALGGDRRRLAITLAVGVVLSVVVRAAVRELVTTADFPLPTTYADALLAGALVAVLRTLVPLPRLRFVAPAVLVVATLLHPVDRTVAGGILLLWLTAVGVVLVLAATGGSPWLRWRALVELGGISYGLYLIHQPVLVAARAWFPTAQPSVRGAVAVAVSVALAFASRRTFEAWFLARKREPPWRRQYKDLPGPLPEPG